MTGTFIPVTFCRKIQDIMKAEDTQTDIFGCCEPEPFEELPFDIDSKVNKVHHKAEKDKEQSQILRRADSTDVVSQGVRRLGYFAEDL